MLSEMAVGDAVLTTRELARMIDRAGIKFTALPDEEFDQPLGVYSGAGTMKRCRPQVMHTLWFQLSKNYTMEMKNSADSLKDICSSTTLTQVHHH